MKFIKGIFICYIVSSGSINLNAQNETLIFELLYQSDYYSNWLIEENFDINLKQHSRTEDLAHRDRQQLDIQYPSMNGEFTNYLHGDYVTHELIGDPYLDYSGQINLRDRQSEIGKTEDYNTHFSPEINTTFPHTANSLKRFIY